MNEEKKQLIVNELKNKLRITWDNTRTNEELMQNVADAESYMNHLLGAEIDYTAPGITHILFVNYCMYIWNGCEHEFEEAYLKDIIRARAIYEVKSSEEKKNTGIE